MIGMKSRKRRLRTTVKKKMTSSLKKAKEGGGLPKNRALPVMGEDLASKDRDKGSWKAKGE